ncbi:translocon-associated protein subunit beta [Grus japonensis]|uniref:Translocon-associated protein subunit beta n=1 Tax=Grus japonensis TaxID=30415 RepID=A0ABC9XU62_GRUJA
MAYLAQEGGRLTGGILAQRESDRRFSPRFLERAVFGVMTLPSVGMPLWYSSERKYDTLKTEEKRAKSNSTSTPGGSKH